MKSISALLSIILLTFAACASAPIATNLTTITSSPEEYRNKRIEISGSVIDNPMPQGDSYRTWSFVIGIGGMVRITASEEGFNPATIEKAYRLVEKARLAGDKVTVTGRLRVGPYRELASGMELDLDCVHYGGTSINTDKGPFVGHYYPHYYGNPFFFHYGFYHYH